MDPSQSQGPSLEDDGLQGDLQMLDVAAVDHGLQGEVIDSLILVCVGLRNDSNIVLVSFIIFGFASSFFVFLVE